MFQALSPVASFYLIFILQKNKNNKELSLLHLSSVWT